MRQILGLLAVQPSSRSFFAEAFLRRFSECYQLRRESQETEDDYYNLLLTNPTPNASKVSIEPLHLTAENAPSPSPLASASIASTSDGPPRTTHRILFSTPLAGPSARMRGLSRGEKGLDRPPEPDNCCMSGCVNCVWDAYREEVEEWAAARKRREANLLHELSGNRTPSAGALGSAGGSEGSIRDIDEAGSSGAYEGMDLDDEEGLFEGVPVGIQEFMKQEKRLRERRAQESH